MKVFLSNILLAFLWMMLTGNISIVNFIIGYLICYLVLWLLLRSRKDSHYFRKLPRIFDLIGFFIKEFLKANFKIAYDIVTPRLFMKPGIIGYKTRVSTSVELMLFSNMITLTPGTLSLEYSEEEKILFVHVMYLVDEVAMCDELRVLEDKILSITRE